MRCLPAVLLVVLALTAPAHAPARAGEPAAAPERAGVVRTAHYELATDGPAPEAAEWGRMLEAAWPQFAAFFGAEPKLRAGERLRVAFFETDAPWRAAIVAGGGQAPDSGGYYCPVARVAYVKRQPSPWYTRTLLLHEAAHQFHWLSRTSNAAPAGNWYVEGIAEHLGSHTWDGTTLRLGVVPLVSLEDRAGAAREALDAPGFSLDTLLSAAEASRPEAMYLVRYLATEQRRAFDTVARKLDRGAAVDAREFARAVGRPERFVAAWRAFTAAQQETFDVGFVDWDARGPALLRGRGSVVSVCRTALPARRVAARITRVGDGRLRAGVLVDWRSAEEYTLALVTDDGTSARLEVDRRAAGAWTRLRSLPLERADGPWDVVAVRGDGSVAVLVAGRTITEVPAEGGALGLALDACEADFAEIVVEN